MASSAKTPPLGHRPLSANARSALARRLAHDIAGDVLFDPFSLARYATDASPYQTFPAGVVLPKTQDDVAAAVNIAREAGVPITARGGGTGQSGQAIGEGLILDFSKYLTRLLYHDTQSLTCIVEPGITLAALNAALKPEKIWFPVDIASAQQATIGGMAGTDAIGARALIYGRMRDNIVAMDTLLADGSEASFGEIDDDLGHDGVPNATEALILDLLETVESAEATIEALPRILGAQPGYNVAALLTGGTPQNMAAFLTGSEGTLAIARRIELKLARRPRNRALGICHFPTLTKALGAVAAIVKLGPTAVELADRVVLELGLQGLPGNDPVRRVMRNDTGASLFVEFMEGNRVANARKLKELTETMIGIGLPRAVAEVMGPAAQNATWGVRRRGLMRLYSNTSPHPVLAPIEELALPLARLADAAEALGGLLARHGLNTVWHGHAGAGALYLRPWLNRGDKHADAAAVVRDASAVLRERAGSLASSQGHGVARSRLLERLRDPAMTALFEEIKLRFDPANLFNPGKIVFPPDASEPELWRSEPAPEDVHDPALLPACEATGRCRKHDDGMMCPSFRATGDERESPRGRANTLRLALAGALGPDALASEEMAETMRTCVSCKACRSECPNGVDIAAAKIAVNAARAAARGLTRFERTAAYLPHYAPSLRKWRHVLNLRDFVPWAAALSERLTGLAADRPWPRLRSQPFLNAEPIGDADGREVLLFPDTFNQYFDPVTLRSAADVLGASGFRVIPLLPPEGERPYCCGRTFLEAGLIDEAHAEAQRLITAAAPFITRGVPFVGLETSCLLTIRDKYHSMHNTAEAEGLARSSMLFEEVMTQPAAVAALEPHLRKIEAEALCVGHCHQHACGSAPAAKSAAALVPGLSITAAPKSCCGMGTTFGYAPETVSVSLQMGEASLFPQIRKTGRDTLIIADGFSCRTQILHGTGRTARHTAVLLKLSLAAREKFGSATDGKDTASAKRLLRLRRQYFR